MKLIEKLITRLAFVGTGWTLAQTPADLSGWRGRVWHFAIGCGWMGKGGQYDDRTFWQRIFVNPNARAHFRFAFTGRFSAQA